MKNPHPFNGVLLSVPIAPDSKTSNANKVFFKRKKGNNQTDNDHEKEAAMTVSIRIYSDYV